MSKGDLKISGNKSETEGRARVTLILHFFFFLLLLLFLSFQINRIVITQIDLETVAYFNVGSIKTGTNKTRRLFTSKENCENCNFFFFSRGNRLINIDNDEDDTHLSVNNNLISSIERSFLCFINCRS